jgi:tetratricopeptide (TPR) repeat protein
MIRKAVLLAETVPDAWLAISRVYRKLERYDEELQALQVFATTNPRNNEVNARIGELMLKKGDTEAALEKLETAGASAADDPAVLKALAQGYAQTGQYDKAIEALQRAGKAAPNDTLVRLRLVDLYRQTGQTEKLLEEYKGLVEMGRDNRTLLGYAKLLFENKKFEEAGSAIEDIRATQPDNRDALMLLGAVLRAQQKHPEAIKVYEEISFIDPTDGSALFERAETHLENGQPYWAEAFYKRTLQRNPKHALAELGLARVAKLQRNRDAYRLHISRASALAPDDPAIQQEREADLQQAW